MVKSSEYYGIDLNTILQWLNDNKNIDDILESKNISKEKEKEETNRKMMMVNNNNNNNTAANNKNTTVSFYKH